MNILNCIELRNKIETKIKDEIERIDIERDGRPSLCVVMVGDNPASIAYVTLKTNERLVSELVLTLSCRLLKETFLRSTLKITSEKQTINTMA